MTKKLVLKNDFHNTEVILRVKHNGKVEIGDVVELTASQVKKAKSALCCKDCICSGELGTRAYWHRLGDNEIKFEDTIRQDNQGRITGATLYIRTIFA